MHILIPGRHHLLTNFQFNYIQDLLINGVKGKVDVLGDIIDIDSPVESICFAVTSANHAGTKRNPIPFYLRAMMLQSFIEALDCTGLIYGIDDVGTIDNFASYTIKSIRHQSNGQIDINPNNTLVICSTPILKSYQQLGYTILPCELSELNTFSYRSQLPWRLVEEIAFAPDSLSSKSIKETVHSSTLKTWANYNLGNRVSKIMNDPILGEDGDITESRDYGLYVRQMDEIAELKYAETKAFIIPGNVGDIGCAVGSWIKFACDDNRLAESDFHGIEVARQLYDICIHRRNNLEFSNANVFFAQRNAVAELVFQQGTMHTIHTSSLTHEIVSYGSLDDLRHFISNRYEELINQGVWINRDVIGPENGEEQIWMLLNNEDGINTDFDKVCSTRDQLSEHLKALSTFSRFLRFVQDFRKEENEKISYSIVDFNGETYIKTRLKDACEYMLTKDYTGNWQSEMHENFCFWSFSEWKECMISNGFEILPGSGAYTNPWIKENRFDGKVSLFRMENNQLTVLPTPPTNALIIGKKRDK